VTSVHADVVVVGAGVTGSSTAFHLTRLGVRDVLVLDRGAPGSGMSSRSSALVRMHYTFRPEVELAVRSDRMFERWQELVGRPACVTRTGFVRVVFAQDEDRLRHNVAMQREVGADVRLVTGDELGELAPGMRTDDIAVAAYEPAGGFGDGAVVAGDFLAAARDAGAGFSGGTEVRELLVRGDEVRGVVTDGGPIEAGTVVLATGPWSPPLLARHGLSLPIALELHHVAVVHHRPGEGAPLACIDSTTERYFRPEGSRRTTLIGTLFGSRPATVEDAASEPALDDLATVVDAAAYRVPALETAGIGRGVSGVYDMTPDGRPLLGAVEGLDGLVLAVGFSGTGFKISPAVGEALAEFVVHGKSHGVDLRPFRPSRFDEGEPISPPWSYTDEFD
jgi:sarcosine oxidase, subunit beta